MHNNWRHLLRALKSTALSLTKPVTLPLLLALFLLLLSACAAQAPSRQLSVAFLTANTALQAALEMAEFTPGSKPAQNRFEGILRITMRADTSRMEILKDSFEVTSDTALRVAIPPDLSLALIQYGNTLLPAVRGIQRTRHPYWEYIVEPGRVWQQVGDGEWSRASLPFTLKEMNQNCLHNGVLSFLFKNDGSVSRVAYQVGSETCQYLHVNLWGVAGAHYQRQNLADSEQIIGAWQQETVNGLKLKPITALVKDYPGFNPARLLPPARADISVYGLVVDGVHYRSECPTRLGPYPYCDVIDLPSFSLAKSIFAGLGYMMMVRQWPEFADISISALVPQCRLEDGRWDDVTTYDLVNMMSGNYRSAGHSVDEDLPVMSRFFLAESHADKLRFSCETWPRQQSPATTLVYHTTDHYLLGTAMTAFLKRKNGPQADIFRDLIVKNIFQPLNLSQTSRVSQRTYDDNAQPFTAYGLFLRPNDIARLGNFLHTGSTRPDLFRRQDFDAAMFKTSSGIRHWHDSDTEAYSLGFWGFDVARYLPCTKQTWIPFMSGYGGIVFALFPNGVSYLLLHRWWPWTLERCCR